jgi:hypothetical protein
MENVQETVTRLFIATDQRDWQTVQQCFASHVELDYSSMNQQVPTQLTPIEIINGWKNILPGFEYTHHQLGNFVIQTDKTKAHLFCYGTASHYLTAEQGNLWTVVGSYDFDLVLENKQCKITRMKFNFKFQEGNLSLPALAMSRVKK